MDQGVLMTREADVAALSRFLRGLDRFHRAAFGEDPVGVLEPDHFVDLEQVDVVRPQPLQGLVDLPRRVLVRAAVDLGHEEDLVAEPLEGLPHAQFADAVVVVPAVVHESDACIDGGADDPDRVGFLVDRAEVVAADADEGDAIARAAEAAVPHVTRDGLAGVLSQ